MCGIAGISLTNGAPLNSSMLKAMATSLQHRGPDGEGFVEEGSIGLAHRRLSIIDIDGGAQPLWDETGETALIANGEIYNYKALQSELISSGVKLKTGSDCEPILHLYKRHGTDFPHYLHGMYAVAIYDKAKNQIILARDPFGIKPLYVAVKDEGIAFASEPSAITKAGWVEPQVNQQAVPNLFNRQYSAGRHTLFAGVDRVLPGEVLIIEDGKIIHRNRHLPPLWPPRRQSLKKALGTFSRLWRHTVADHLQADVPYGAFLSGGVDSSAVVAQMAELQNTPKTYTIGFASAEVADERAEAERLAANVEADHTAITFSEKDFWAYLPQMVEALDDLVADYAALPLLKLAEFAKKDVKVVLSGEGGDELFAGYGRYQFRWWHWLMGRSFRGKGDAQKFPQLFATPEMINWKEPIYDPIPYPQPRKRGMSPQPAARRFTALQHRQAQDIMDWLPDDLLQKVDRCLMRHSIEGRVPFLGDELAAFAFSLPNSLKIRGKHGKWLLKNWLSSHQPATEPFAKKKGFTVPIAEWLERRRPRLGDYLLGHVALNGTMHTANFEQFLSQPIDQKQAKLLFTILCYVLWYDTHIAGLSSAELCQRLGLDF